MAVATGTIDFELEDATSLTGTSKLSQVVEIEGTRWRLHVSQRKYKNTGPFLRVFVYHVPSDSNLWSCMLNGSITLLGRSSLQRPLNSPELNCEQNSWGYCDFLDWGKALAVENGYLKDGKLRLHAHLALSNIVGFRRSLRFDFSDGSDVRHSVALLVGGERIFVSMEYLALHSPFFNTMFYGDFTEKGKYEIELKDVNSEEFVEMLNVIYPSRAKITDSSVQSLLLLGDRFQIKAVVDDVELFLLSSSSSFSLPAKLLLSDKFRLVKLQEECLGTLKHVKDITDLKTAPEYKLLSDKARAALLGKVMKMR